MIVLNELRLEPGKPAESAGVEALEKKPAVVVEHPGLEHQNVGDFGRRRFHRALPSASAQRGAPFSDRAGACDAESNA
jgi:hypothetical protein